MWRSCSIHPRQPEHPGAAERAIFAASKPDSFTHDEVSAWLDRGLAQLIDLHAWAELEDPELNADIWALLDRHSERHKLNL